MWVPVRVRVVACVVVCCVAVVGVPRTWSRLWQCAGKPAPSDRPARRQMPLPFATPAVVWRHGDRGNTVHKAHDMVTVAPERSRTTVGGRKQQGK